MNHGRSGIRFIALLEATKGVVVLLVGFGVLGIIHSGAQHVFEELARHFHLNPASRFPRIFLQLATHANDSTLWLLAGAAVSYSGLRFIEAFGLWRGRRWAEWFGTITGAAYIPMEIYELLHGITWPKMTLLSVNVFCVVFLMRGLQQNKVTKRMVNG